MFDKTITLWSTDHTVAIQVTAGTEGIKDNEVQFIYPEFPPKILTEQQAIDALAAAIKASFTTS